MRDIHVSPQAACALSSQHGGAALAAESRVGRGLRHQGWFRPPEPAVCWNVSAPWVLVCGLCREFASRAFLCPPQPACFCCI